MLKLENVHKAFGGVIAVDHVTLDTSFSPAAAGGYQGPEWAAPAVA